MGDAGVIVDGDMGELVTGAVAAGVAWEVTGDAMVGFVERSEPLDVDVDEFARGVALVAWPWLLGLDSIEPAEPAGPADARDGGGGEADLGCDVALGVAVEAQGLDGIGCCGRGFGSAMNAAATSGRASLPIPTIEDRTARAIVPPPADLGIDSSDSGWG